MPGAAHGVADYDAIGERTVIMRAMGADREQLRPATHQENLVIAGMTDELAAIGKLRERNALHQIRTGGLSLLLSHSFHPWRSEIAFAAWRYRLVPLPYVDVAVCLALSRLKNRM